MRSIAKALIIIVCVVIGAHFIYINRIDAGVIFLLVAGVFAVFYEAKSE